MPVQGDAMTAVLGAMIARDALAFDGLLVAFAAAWGSGV
jgi:hypothetical protein